MRVILDANIYISYLLASKPGNVISSVVEYTVLDDRVELYLPKQLVAEVVDSVSTKPYLRNRISRQRIEDVLTLLISVATIPPPIEHEIQHYVRDINDDYLVAYGLLVDADFLVTGDKDLLVLGHIHNLQVLSPVRFWNKVEIMTGGAD